MKYSLTILLICICSIAFSQGQIAKEIARIETTGAFKDPVQLFSEVCSDDPEINKTVKSFTLFSLTDQIDEFIDQAPQYLKLSIPGKTKFTVLLYKVDISANGFTLLTSNWQALQLDKIVHYRGAIEGDPRSVVSFSFSKNETMGMIANDQGNYVLGKLQDQSGRFILYNDRDLIPVSGFQCGNEINAVRNNAAVSAAALNTTAATVTKCVNWYWETDYDVFVNKGSVANVTSYMQGVFNQVATLYANDGFTITLKTLFVWSTVDPYTGPTTGDYLNQFGAYRTSFNGDLAHLIGYNGGGGIAWVNGVYCGTAAIGRQGYSGIQSSYNAVPTYSWTVECIAHEEGHLFGSGHTHDCIWNGNNTQIDGCGDAVGYKSGTCPTIPLSVTIALGGGTIMSYCHLPPGISINFNLGFGQQPKDLMANMVNNYSCLSQCGANPCTAPGQPLAIYGTSVVTAGSTQIYFTQNVTGADSYQWSLPTGWTGNSVTTSVVCKVGPVGSFGQVTVRAVDSCGPGPIQSMNVAAIGPLSICPHPLQIVIDTVIQRPKELFCNAKGATNRVYNWYRNRVKLSWIKEHLANSYYKAGDSIKVVVTSSNPNTPKWCYKPDSATIVVKPTSATFTTQLQFYSIVNDIYNISVYTMIGQRVAFVTVHAKKGDNQIPIALTPGNYLIKLRGDQGDEFELFYLK